MAQSIRDQLRSATLGKKSNFRTKIFNYEGLDVEFRAPNLKQRQNIIKKSKDKNGDLDVVDFIAHSVIECTYVPGTNDNVYEQEDYDALMQQGSGSFVEIFGAEVSALMGVEDEEADAKNS